MDHFLSPPGADKNAIKMATIGGNEAVVVESFSEDSSQLSQVTPSSQASQDLRLRVEPPSGKSRSAEKVLDQSRRSQRVAGISNVGTDDVEPIDLLFAAKIKSSAILLRFDCWNEATGEEVPYVGQAGFLRNPKKLDEIKLATCKHNLATDFNDDGQLEICGPPPHKCVLHNFATAYISIPETGWRRRASHAVTLRGDVTWSHGIDISLGPAIHEGTPENQWATKTLNHRRLEFLLPKVQCFDVVDECFRYEDGLKIGIVTFNTGSDLDKRAFSEVGGVDNVEVADTWASRTNGMTKSKYEEILGPKDSVMIYTGTITKGDSDLHIEYNVNTCKGCSGAIVIVMERGHPDFGKALAIHVGYKGQIGQNIGFKLAGVFDRNLW